jgi:hypothetical protein
MRVRFNRTICRAATGAVSPLATVEVRLQSTNALASLYAAISGGSPLANPFTADANGFVGFFLESDAYRLIITSADASESQELIYEPVSDPDAVDQAQFTAALDLKQDDLGFTPINKAGDTGIGALQGTSFDASSNLKAPVINVEGGDPIQYFKDTNTLGANLFSAAHYLDSGDNIIGKIGFFNASGSYEIYNPGRDIKLNSSSVTIPGSVSSGGTIETSFRVRTPLLYVIGTLPTQFFVDTDTLGANISAFTSYNDSSLTLIGRIGFFNGDGSYEIENTGRIIRLDSGSVDVTGAFNCVGLATLKNLTVDVASGDSYIDFKSGGTQFGRIRFGTATEMAILNGAGSPFISFTATSYTIFNATTLLGNLTMANFDINSVKNLQVNTNITAGGAIVSSSGVSQVAKLGVATSSLGSDVLAVNGSTTFYSHTVTNGNTSATGSVTGGTVVSNGDATVAGNLNLTGSAKRIIADWSNSTVSSRALLQTSTANSATGVTIAPTGTGTTAAVTLVSTSGADNSSRLTISANLADCQIRSDIYGSGSHVPLNILVGGSVRQAISTAGDAGFGVTSPTTKAKLQTSNGIHLGNSANSNTDVLDYYEEQISSTPSAIGGTVAGAPTTYTSRTCKGTRKGNEVSVIINIGWTGHTGTGDLFISGLPFTNFSINAPISIHADGLIGVAGSTMFQGYGLGGNSNIAITSIIATTGVKSAVPIAANVTNLIIGITYQIL